MTQTRQEQQNEFEKAWDEPGPITEAVQASQSAAPEVDAEKARAAREYELGHISLEERKAIEAKADEKK